MFEESTLQLLQGGVSADYFEGESETTLDEHLQTLRASRARIDAVEANVLVAMKRTREQASPSARHSDGADDLTEKAGESRREARKKTRRAELIDHHPAVAEALAAGHITAGHADCLSAIPAKYHEAFEAQLDELLGRAAKESVDEFSDTMRGWKERQSARKGEDYHKSRRDQRTLSLQRDRHTGLTRISGLLDPENAATAKTVLGAAEQDLLREDQEAAKEDPEFVKRTTGQRMADGFVELCRRARSVTSETHTKPEPTVIVGIPLSDLITGLGDGEAFGGGAISAETARRLACEGGIIPAVLGSEGQILDLGRRTRLATANQRLAMQARYGGCAVPGCDAPFEWCHMHHIDRWEAGGPTDLVNLIPVCTRHHAQIHEGRLEIARDAAGCDHWHRPKPPEADRDTKRKRRAEARHPRNIQKPNNCDHADPNRQQTLLV